MSTRRAHGTTGPADDAAASLRGVLEAYLPVQAAALDAEGRVLTATPLLRQSPQARELGDVIGRSWLEVLPEALIRAADLERRIARVMESGHQVVLPRVDVVEDGRSTSYMVTLAPLEHPAARVGLYLEDVTDLVASAARERDAEALAALAGLASTLAHEIRNPLAGMSGALQVLLRGLGRGDPKRQMFRHILSHIERLGALVEALITFSRPKHPEMARVDLRQVVSRAVEEGLDVGLGATELEGEGLAWADPELLERAVAHLIRNAWQSGAQRVRVRISPGGIVVEDDGAGVTAPERARIFQPFYTTRLHGLGLGLAEARRALESMDGSLECCPSSLGGAGFSVRVPHLRA